MTVGFNVPVDSTLAAEKHDPHFPYPPSSSSLPASEPLIPDLDQALLDEDALVHRIRQLSPPLQPHLGFVPTVDVASAHVSRHHHHPSLLAAARAAKSVHRHNRHTFLTPLLPHEILVQVFENLLEDQPALWSAASVCLDWNLCATSLLYRFPQFSSTLHWALFIQTLCRSKEVLRPKTRRRRSVIQSLSRSRQFSHHPPSQLAPAQIEVYGGRAQWTNSRLCANLGEFVRGIDLSRKIVHIDPSLSACSPAVESPASSNRGCMSCRSRDKSIHGRRSWELERGYASLILEPRSVDTRSSRHQQSIIFNIIFISNTGFESTLDGIGRI
ncbi:hypothetical protein BGZ98_007289 [Dissophora globulifera]|nr:hypothetical protein BGZ98_007289 [Dissophora globulifera]